jgi:lysophospholipase L1-like esterase
MATLPPLITEQGLVLNNMMPDQGALGGYTPLGTASSEGVSLMLRGMARAAIATGDSAKADFCHFLFDAACQFFFRGERPTDETGQGWHHSWICNGGAAFNVRGPLQSSGDLALSGYIYGRDTQSSVTFTAGVGQLNPAPDIVYQVVSPESTFVWLNVFSDLETGVQYDVEYYIDAGGNKIFGTQKGGSFGQPAIPAGQHNDGAPGKIVLTTNANTVCGVNYCTTVVDVMVPYGDLYEAWPMWRKLADNEVSTAADAIHWFLDAFSLGMEMEPNNPDWRNAFDRMMEVWIQTCDQESNNTRIFQAGADGPYNNFPLTYGYAYGRDDIDDPATNWNAVPPTSRYVAERSQDGYVAFTMQNESAEVGSGLPIRYGVAFENNPVYIDYTANSQFAVDMKSTINQTVSMAISGEDEQVYETILLIGPDSVPQNVGVGQFYQFQQSPGDADGTQSGDWEDDGSTLPEYAAVPFPGRRLAMVGDSITHYNTAYIPPKGNTGMYENWGSGVCGYWTHADHILDGRLSFEPGITTDVQGQKHGLNFAIAGTRVVNWWEESDDTLGDGVLWQGPMYAALNNISRFDVVVMMGGTNDLSGNIPAPEVLFNIKRAATDLASRGKWVFLMAICPRTRDLLKGYSISEMDTIRARLEDVNEGLRSWVASGTHPNIWLVDATEDLLGPNGIDPFGMVSDDVNPLGTYTLGNYSPEFPGHVACHDGLHPGPIGAYVMGRKLAEVMVEAGVPARPSRTQLGSLTLGPNIIPNSSLSFTAYKATATIPVSFNLSSIGWATGLGNALLSGGNHAGYQHGVLPDCWNLWKSTNDENQVMGIGVGGNYSNFMNYTWGDLAGEYPKVLEYMGDATFAPGTVSVSIVTDEGVPAIKIDLNIPATGNKNESFVVVTSVPRDQHGPWDNWGWNSPDQGDPRANTVFSAGNTLLAEADIKMVNLVGQMLSCNLALSTFANIPAQTFGSVRQSFGNHLFFWPPSDMDKIRLPVGNRTIHMRAPAITVPPYQSGETIRYADFKFQFSFDCSTSGVVGSIILKNNSLRKVTSALPL